MKEKELLEQIVRLEKENSELRLLMVENRNPIPCPPVLIRSRWRPSWHKLLAATD